MSRSSRRTFLKSGLGALVAGRADLNPLYSSSMEVPGAAPQPAGKLMRAVINNCVCL